jgi:hypothetical protein
MSIEMKIFRGRCATREAAPTSSAAMTCFTSAFSS